MILSTLAALGADLAAIEAQLHQIIPEAFRVYDRELTRGGIHGHQVTVLLGRDEVAADARVPSHHHAHGHDHPHAHAHGHDPAEPHGHDHPHAPMHAPGEAQAPGDADAHSHACHDHAPLRTLPAIRALLTTPALPERVRKLALAVFGRIADAEARIHGTTPEQVHFHEVGAVDALVDIVGSCLALEQLGVDAVTVGPLPVGRGTMRCAHGMMPLPAPATAEILAGHPIEATDEPFELVTPTGAALLITWAAALPLPKGIQRITRTGFGFGQRELAGRPNVLRGALLALDGAPDDDDSPPTDAWVLACNLDDCPGEWVGDTLPRLMEAGALDVWTTAIGMKKGRPGIQLSALCGSEALEAVSQAIFRHTTTFGIRRYPVTRQVLARRHVDVDTPYGTIRVKVGAQEGVQMTRSPEYEDCCAAAGRHGVAAREVYRAAIAATESAPSLGNR